MGKRIISSVIIILAYLVFTIRVSASGGEEMAGSQLEQFENLEETEYALFLETNVGYGVTLDYYKYGIFGDFTKDEQEGEDIYFKLCEKILGNKLELNTHEEWYGNRSVFIQNVSPDMKWVISKQYIDESNIEYISELYYEDQKLEQKQEYEEEKITLFALRKKENDEAYELVEEEKIKKQEELVMDTWEWEYCQTFIAKEISCMDEYGKLLAISEPDNQSIGIYDTENWSMIHHITINGIDTDYPIEISQVAGDEEKGWMVLSNGDATYRMTYPDGETEKIGEFMYDTTYSPDGKYRAYCTGNAVLDELWTSFPDEKLDKINNLYIEWAKIPPGWYVEELTTGKKTYIPIETWKQDNRPIYGGRCVWIQKDKLLQILNS